MSDRKEEKTFKEKYLAGDIEFEEIDNDSLKWGQGDEIITLSQYLGLNAEEEEAWISIGEEELQNMLDAQKK